MTGVKEAVATQAAACAAVAIELSHAIADDPELGFAEHHAADLLCRTLADRDYHVVAGVAGLDTAFTATAGHGDLVVGLCAEYDALPGIGHACGHNVIAGASVLAALALRPFVEQLGVTLRIVGSPAEEGGGGKIVLLRAGAFDGLHAALMVHPAPHDLVVPAILAMEMLEVEVDGFTPPSMHPERGRSAADAVTALQNAVAMLRQHLRITDRITGYIVAEGSSANVLPASASLRYCLRASSSAELAEVDERFRDCVAGAALISGTSAKITQPHPTYDGLRHDVELGELYCANAERLGRSFPSVGQDNLVRSASTDFGNVSQQVAAIHPLIGIDAGEFSNHQAPFAEACRGESGDRAVIDAGLALAWTVVDAALDPECRGRLTSRSVRVAGSAL